MIPRNEVGIDIAQWLDGQLSEEEYDYIVTITKEDLLSLAKLFCCLQKIDKRD